MCFMPELFSFWNTRHSAISNFLLQLPARLFVRPIQMQAGIIAGSFGGFSTIDRKEHFNNNIPFLGLCLAVRGCVVLH